MFRFQKTASFLSVLTALSVVMGSVPLNVFAEVYTGELRLPNTRVVPDYRQAGGYGQVSVTGLNNSYFPSAPAFSARESNNFVTSLPQKTFYASVRDGTTNCTSDDININANDGSIILTYIAPETGDSSGGDPLCLPTGPASTAQNTVLANTGSGNSYGGLGVTQTYDALPFVTLGESAQNTTVESIPNDPDNVRVTVNENVIQESYGLHAERRGDVWTVYNYAAPWAQYPEFGAIVKDGKTYVLNWLSNWVGQVPILLGDEYGTVLWGDPSTANYDGDSGRTTYDPLYVNTGYPTPLIVQLASIAPSTSDSVIRPRNSDVISITQPVCTRGSSDGFWRSTVWIRCITYGLSADGRIGTADYYNQQSGRGWGFQLLSFASTFLGAVTLGNVFMAGNLSSGGFSLMETLTSTLGVNVTGTLGLDFSLSSLYNAVSISSGAVSVATLAGMTAAFVSAVSGPTALGTVESSNGLGVGTWTWSQAPGFIPTTGGIDDGDNDLCLNIAGIQTTVPEGYTRDATNETCIPNVCANGAGDWPVCTIILNRCSDGTPIPPSGVCPRTGTDLCLNIDGMQTEVPAGYTRDASGECDTTTDSFCPDGVTPIPPSGNCGGGSGDLCTNLAEVQTSVPAGYTRDASGECAPTDTPSPSPISCTDQVAGGAVQCFSVSPTLLRSGERTTLVWNVSDAESCSVSGTNNDRWPNQKASKSGGETSSAITGQTTFTLNCAALEGAPGPASITESAIVNLIPIFCEPGVPGC